MPPSLSNWVYEKTLYIRFRRRVRSVLHTGPTAEVGPHATAELCLRRALTLQREARRTSLLRQREALASVCRSTIEATLIGLYSLEADPDDVSLRVARGAVKSASRLSKPWLGEVDDPILGLWESLGLPDSRGMPNLSQIADRVDAVGDPPVGRLLYWEFYVPLCETAVHTTGASLARYRSVGSNALRRRPLGAIPRQGLVRAADGCTALLAGHLAEARGIPSAWFLAYGHRQLKRANRPYPILLLTFTLSSIPWLLSNLRQLPAWARAVVRVLANRRMRPPQDDERAVSTIDDLAAIGLSRPSAEFLYSVWTEAQASLRDRSTLP
ncbi:MAG: hypothetical protein JJU45_15205 [Acidimicrobiia bacterium]|nr:hypothetical protein [Acidimicrobiia bacterium]